ncbi:uncharacterized protein KD926_007734 [Aspergillus affinis]|uniref:uncharacterized protein n=1 Tax=Aspergillus affinis TaxID=1070780 RepID=UPI0022FE0620|nr:uncharacterized protein KD926_007734 [Aspergillus affinis]KAI9040790.1 hypothetical protein KD926_007734 [Aspergillus affinis]
MASETAPIDESEQSYHPGDGVERCRIDGHRFEFDDNVPDEVRYRMHDLSVNDAKFADIPAEYLKYEVKYDPWAEIDNVIIDGHVFAVNYDVPADVSTALIELARRPRVRFQDVPRDYMKYHDSSGGWVRDQEFPATAITYCQGDTDQDKPNSERDDKDEKSGREKDSK